MVNELIHAENKQLFGADLSHFRDDMRVNLLIALLPNHIP